LALVESSIVDQRYRSVLTVSTGKDLHRRTEVLLDQICAPRAPFIATELPEDA
jgi:hypothetical protein